MKLLFDQASHTYSLDGVVIPNVTSILEPLVDYSRIPAAIMEKARQRGDYVHKACELYLWDMLEEDAIEPEYEPYIDAFKLFLSETGFVADLIEHRVYHPRLRYAGTLDLGGTLPPLGRRKRPIRALIDLKTTFKLMASVGPQTAAYVDAHNSSVSAAERFEARYGLQLKGDGSYKLLPMKEPSDMNVFLSCLNIYNFMKTRKDQ